MSIPYIQSQVNMFMCRFPIFMRCYSCKLEFDKKDMWCDPLSDDPHVLVCVSCKDYALKWIEKSKNRKSHNTRRQEQSPIDAFHESEKNALFRFNS